MQELEQYYGLNITSPTIDDIEQALNERTQVSPEIQRLKQLQQQGFLANIERAYQRCLYAVPNDSINDSSANAMEVAPRDLIVNVVTLSNQWLPDDATIREWRQQFLELIEQLREGMVEF